VWSYACVETACHLGSFFLRSERVADPCSTSRTQRTPLCQKPASLPSRVETNFQKRGWAIVSSAGMSRRRNPEKLRSSVGTNRGCAIGIQRNSEIVSTVQVLAARLTLSLSRNAPRTADLASKGARTEWSQLRDLNSRPAVYEITHTRCRKGQQRTKRQKLSSRDCFDNGTKVNSGYEKGVQMGVAPSLAPRVAPSSGSGHGDNCL